MNKVHMNSDGTTIDRIDADEKPKSLDSFDA
jgi:hypothetical protein